MLRSLEPTFTSAPYFTTKFIGFDVTIPHPITPAWTPDSSGPAPWDNIPDLRYWVEVESGMRGAVVVNHMLAALESRGGREREMGHHAYELYHAFCPIFPFGGQVAP
ncbi:hypothetical protein GGTG_13119 [Gaeumannomyces tritici R3-111a-1]|uniref:Uncharacterized protein n=1 Tax=Gaeumannomyces tritici (strain R3-111a-1) TaxID=644352 RepID=J3PHY8_GAET3|nr:hypothetical protein GGTG_13119 [Gaeumannomyces tritici R3-111a-1]EJT69500.1 hypothetical protein GGTG_13119 [Gaeumannomyces tritici R3-111a-1]